MTHMRDEDIVQFAKLPRDVLDALIEASARMPLEFWGDLVALLRMAETRQTPGCYSPEMNHDARGRVHGVLHKHEWRRQPMRKTA